MRTIYGSIIEACNNSSHSMLDANPDYFFGKEIPCPIPFADGDILDYISSLTDGFLESENKMAVYNGRISKIDVDAQDCMLDTERFECYPIAILEDYEDVVRFYQRKGYMNTVYLVSKDYDVNDDKTTYCLSMLTSPLFPY